MLHAGLVDRGGLSSEEMQTPEHDPRAFGVDEETLTRWRNRGLLRARPLRSDQYRLGGENAAPVTEVGAASIIASDGPDLVAVRARPVD